MKVLKKIVPQNHPGGRDVLSVGKSQSNCRSLSPKEVTLALYAHAASWAPLASRQGTMEQHNTRLPLFLATPIRSWKIGLSVVPAVLRRPNDRVRIKFWENVFTW